ncbi:MAG TPA: hypothetical protein VGM84_21875 [Steroidobacteraceae bacterium]|jgi:hypothetical protein
MALRIYADLGTIHDSECTVCGRLRHGSGPGNEGRPLDEVAHELGLRIGMPVTLFYEDPAEKIEVSAVLGKEEDAEPQWNARIDWRTIRRLRDLPI